MIDVLGARAREQPDAWATTFLRDGEIVDGTLTYGELDRRARAIGAQLQKRGQAGDPALVLCPLGVEYVAGVFACVYSGLVAVPTYAPSLDQALESVCALVKLSGARVGVTTREMLNELTRMDDRASVLREFDWVLADELAAGVEDEWSVPAIDEDSLVFLVFTSGSTATPKGVMITHRCLLDTLTVISKAVTYSSADRYVSWVPPHVVGSLYGAMAGAVFAGLPSVFMAPEAFMARPARWLEAMSRYQGSICGVPNFAYDLSIQAIPPEQRASLDLSSWRYAWNGGEQVRAETLDRFFTEFESCGLRREAVLTSYGLTEAAAITVSTPEWPPMVRTFDRLQLELGQALLATSGEVTGRTVVSQGRCPMEHELLVVDPDSRIPCPAGIIGEVWTAGPHVAAGYWNQPEETERTFQARRADNDQGPYLRTGDLGFMIGDELFITGRLKELIIIRGRNLSPEDVETTVTASYSGLQSLKGAVFAVERDNAEQLTIVHEIDPNIRDYAHAASAIRLSVAQRHHVQPHTIVLIPPGALPRTVTGKIARGACKTKFLDEKLPILYRSDEESISRGAVSAQYVAPSTPLETVLVAAWTTVLPVDQVGVHDNFFELGGDSLRAGQVVSRLMDDLGVELPVNLLFEHTSVAALAEYIEAPRDAAPTPESTKLRSRSRDGKIPASSAQQRIWITEHIATNTSTYNIAGAVRLRGNLDLDALTYSLTEIVRRHESLRTTFALLDDTLVQVIAPPCAFPIRIVDLQSTPAPEREDHARRILSEEAKHPFDLVEGPLIRAALFRLGLTDHLLGLFIHHIVMDGWSGGVLNRDLTEFYRSRICGTAPLLPELKVQYADYAYWEQEWLRSDAPARQIDYWLQHLADAPPRLDLPSDRPRPTVQSFAGEVASFELSETLLHALKALSRHEGTTLFMTLLAAFQILLARYTDEEDILVGSPIANRTRSELEPLVGCFINSLVFRTDLSGNPTVRELLHRVRDVTLGAYAHQELPFQTLVEAIRPPFDPSCHPIFQTMFILQNAPTGSMVLPDLDVEPFAIHTGGAKFDLTLSLWEAGNILRGEMEYSTDLFGVPTITRMIHHFEVLLEAMCANPEQRIRRLPLMTATERQATQAARSSTSGV